MMEDRQAISVSIPSIPLFPHSIFTGLRSNAMSYIPHTAEQRQRMLTACGVATIDELFADIPASLSPKSFDLGRASSEMEVRAAMRRLEARNRSSLIVFLGGGFYDHYILAARWTPSPCSLWRAPTAN